MGSLEIAFTENLHFGPVGMWATALPESLAFTMAHSIWSLTVKRSFILPILGKISFPQWETFMYSLSQPVLGMLASSNWLSHTAFLYSTQVLKMHFRLSMVPLNLPPKLTLKWGRWKQPHFLHTHPFTLLNNLPMSTFLEVNERPMKCKIWYCCFVNVCLVIDHFYLEFHIQ